MVERVSGAKDCCCFLWHSRRGTGPDRGTGVPGRCRTCLEDQSRKANPDGQSCRRPRDGDADERSYSCLHDWPRTHSERRMTRVGQIKVRLLLDQRIRADGAKLQARRLGCIRSITVTGDRANGTDGHLIRFGRTMVMALTRLQRTRIGDARSQPEQPHHQHYECGATSNAGIKELHDANLFEQIQNKVSRLQQKRV